MPKPTNHLTEALKHLDRAIAEAGILNEANVVVFHINSISDSLYAIDGAIEDAQREIKDCRDAISGLLDDLREATN